MSPGILACMERNRLHALANGIPMDHVEWNRSETQRLFGFIDRNRRQDGFPVFIACGIFTE